MTELKYHPYYVFIQPSGLSSLSESVKAVSKLLGLTDPDQPHLTFHPHHLPMGPGPRFQVILQPSISGRRNASFQLNYSSYPAWPWVLLIWTDPQTDLGPASSLWTCLEITQLGPDAGSHHWTWPWSEPVNWLPSLTSDLPQHQELACWSGLLVEPSYHP